MCWAHIGYHPMREVFSSSFFKRRFYLFIFRQRGREGEREGEKHPCVLASCTPLTGDLACNPGTCPDWELNRWPFGLQAHTQSTEPHHPGLIFYREENEGLQSSIRMPHFCFLATALTFPMASHYLTPACAQWGALDPFPRKPVMVGFIVGILTF